MKKLMQNLKFVLIVVLVLEAVISAGCNAVNNIADKNISYDSIKTAYADNPSNSEISFIYDAINSKISGYPDTVPDFTHLPIDSVIDAINTSERIQIEYADDNNYENGIIIAQEPKKGAAWDDGVIVNLTVNRKYNSINSKWGYMSESLGKLYLLSGDYDSDNNFRGTIWADEKRLIDDEMIKLYVDNGNVYYNNHSGVNKLNDKNVLQVLGKDILNYAIINEKIYYRDIETDGKLYCYNMNDKTNSLVFDGGFTLFYVYSDYIICWTSHDIFILDNKSYETIKAIHCEKMIVDSSLDNDNLYFVQYTYNNKGKGRFELTKYSIKQDTQITVFDSDELVSNILAIDDKIVFFHAVDNKLGIRYIDMRDMENKFFTVENDDRLDSSGDVIDILFDGQRIIYEELDRTFYSICIFTGETKKIELAN